MQLIPVGDPSGSHSERWILHVGNKKHQNAIFGTVKSKNYTYGPGKYDIVLEHGGTNIGFDRDGDGNMDNQCDYWCTGCSPDYDYTALVSKVGGDATVTIENNQGKGASINDIRKILGFLDPLPPCLHLELVFV